MSGEGEGRGERFGVHKPGVRIPSCRSSTRLRPGGRGRKNFIAKMKRAGVVFADRSVAERLIRVSLADKNKKDNP